MYRLLPTCVSLLLLLCLCTTVAYAQTELPTYKQQLLNRANSFAKQSATDLLQPVAEPASVRTKMAGKVEAATYLRANRATVSRLLGKAAPQELKLQLLAPSGRNLNLQLVAAKVFADDFQVFLGSDRSRPLDFKTGSFYWGIVEGHPESAVAIGVTPDEISGMISVDGITYNLGRAGDKQQDLHMLYRSDDLNSPPALGCFADELADQTPASTKLQGNNLEKGADNCVRMYVEVDYDVTVDKGGVSQAANYVSAIFNQVAIMYANESIDFTVSELVVWDVADPYNGSSSTDFLYAFRDRLGGNFNGDLAHLVGYKGGGGVAYLDQLCGSLYRVGYSGIRTTFSEVPTYSWTVEVVTHEIGHNLGSPHTHACKWNGNNTPIDGCGAQAGYSEGCSGPIPTKGTVMSYCHLLSGVGIDLALGFGPQPGDLIRDRVYNRSCMSPCSAPVVNDAGITAVTSPSGNVCNPQVTPTVTLSNFGSANLTSVTISYQIDGGPSITTNWTGTLASGASTSVDLTSTNVGTGSHSITATASAPNGQTDETPANDASSGSFNVQSQQTFYRDADGDGYGNAADPVTDCNAPSGYVTDNTDCNDGDASAYPGAPCTTGDACITGQTLDADCNCGGGTPSADSDNDGVCDGEDVCPGGDDTLDADGNGIPDYCDCNVELTSFASATLTHSGSGSSTTMVTLPSNSKDASFTVSGLDALTGGKPSSRYEESVVVTYVDGNGNTQTAASLSGANQTSANISINGEVQSITVALSDGYDGSAPSTLSVGLSQIDYCAPFVSCPDADNDGTCDSEDSCPNFDNRLIGQPCDDGDSCTENDTWGTDCGCAGTPITGCVACDNEFVNSFSSSPLTHSGSGSSSSSVNLGGSHTGASFTISGMDGVTGGKPANRYNEVVAVTYVDGSGNTVNYGTFSGANQGSVAVNISGSVESITVSLSDGEANNSSLSVNLSDVVSCGPSALVMGSAVSTTVEVFPNPTSGIANLRLGSYTGQATVIVSNMLGATVRQYEVSETSSLELNTAEWTGNQVYLITVYREAQDPVTKRLVVTR